MGLTLQAEAKQHKGIDLHSGKIRMRFTYKGRRCAELLPYDVTLNNIRYAATLRDRVIEEIKNGIFDYAKHFPDSANAKELSDVKVIPTFKELFTSWLELKKTEVRHEAYRHYEQYGKNHILPFLGDRKIDSILKSEIETWRSRTLGHLKNKTINEIFIPVRGVFAMAAGDRLIDFNPVAHIPNLKNDSDDVADPFTLDEISLLENSDTHRVQELNGFLLACWTGLRVSEWIALAWEDIDLVNRQITVSRSCVRGQYQATKTKSSKRVIELIDPAYEILLKQKQHTFMFKPETISFLTENNRRVSKKKITFVFRSVLDQQPIINSSIIADNFFTPLLKKISIRHRGINQARHTFASQLLTRGVAERWIMKQLGHTSMAMMEKHYGRWMESEMPDMAATVSKIFAAENAKNGPELVRRKRDF